MSVINLTQYKAALENKIQDNEEEPANILVFPYSGKVVLECFDNENTVRVVLDLDQAMRLCEAISGAALDG